MIVLVLAISTLIPNRSEFSISQGNKIPYKPTCECHISMKGKVHLLSNRSIS